MKAHLQSFDQLLWEAAESHRGADRDLMLKRILAENFFFPVSEMPSGIRPGETFHVQSDMNVSIPRVCLPDGREMVGVYANPNDSRLGKQLLAIAGAELLQMILRMPAADGLAIQGTTSYLCVAKEEISRIVKTQRRRLFVHNCLTILKNLPRRVFLGSGGLVRVPPGHKVVTTHPTGEPELARSLTGNLIAQLGADGRQDAVLGQIADAAACQDSGSFLWIIQQSYVDTLPNGALFCDKVRRIVQASAARHTHTAVFTRAAARAHESFMVQLRQCGMSVCVAGAEDICFCEVHKPDGSIVALPPGKPLRDLLT